MYEILATYNRQNAYQLLFASSLMMTLLSLELLPEESPGFEAPLELPDGSSDEVPEFCVAGEDD